MEALEFDRTLTQLDHLRLTNLVARGYPRDAEPATGFISVLSPVGSSLLGLHVGATARWRTPLGGESAAEVLAILFQPEAIGDYTM